MNSFKQFVCLSGMPRSGSTLLSAILSQNPEIHAEGNSAVCQLMWDTFQSCLTKSSEQLRANCRESTIHDIISQIPHIYYKNITESIVVDKCRSWTIPTNIKLLENYIDKNIKIIILERPVIEIVKSFVKLYRANNIFDEDVYNKLLIPSSEPIMRSIIGINFAKKNNHNNNFLFINYSDLIENTKETIDKIYIFCDWPPFEHDFNNIIVKYPENDDVYNLKHQHTIKSSIEKSNSNEVILSESLQKKCDTIDNLINSITN